MMRLNSSTNIILFFFPDEVDVQEEIIYGISAISSSAKYRKL